MKKIISVLLSCIIFILLCCSCESEQVKQAKAAYSDGKYSEVVELLSKEENLSESSQDMLTISEANVLYENKEYLEAVKKLASSKDGLQNEQYEEMFSEALNDAIANKSADNVIELLQLDDSKQDVIYEAVTTACNDKDYNGFLVLDGLIEKLEDGDLKTKFASFNDEYDLLRAEAFLVGTWEWQIEGNEKFTKVKVVPYNNNLIGRIAEVGSDLEDYHYATDDMYWENFEFESDTSFIVSNLTKTQDGTAMPQVSSGKIDYESGEIEINVTNALDPIRTWKRIEE